MLINFQQILEHENADLLKIKKVIITFKRSYNLVRKGR
jgi:hypothetical protein